MRRLPALAMTALIAGCAPVGGHTAQGSEALIETGPGWTSAGIEHVPSGPCRIRRTGDGQALPDPRCTPGAVDSTATPQAVCMRGGWEKSHPRPESRLTSRAKRRIMRAYGLDPSTAGDYELDHLVPKSLGGSDDARNLWPQPNVITWARANSFVANDKDALEVLAKRGVCAGRGLSLDAMREGFAGDWTTLKPVLVVPR